MSDERDDLGPEGVGHATSGIAYEEPLLFERSHPGRAGYSLPDLDVPDADPAAALPAAANQRDAGPVVRTKRLWGRLPIVFREKPPGQGKSGGKQRTAG